MTTPATQETRSHFFRPCWRAIKNIPAATMICLVRIYQRHGRQLHNRECIYTPSCSEYAILCFRKYGAITGTHYAITRITRCNGAKYSGGEDRP